MKKELKIIIIALVVLTVGSLGLYFFANNSTTNNTKTQDIEDITKSSELVISADGKLVSYSGVAGETALATLKRLTKVSTSSSSYGEYVIAINDLVADSKIEFWAFYVNNQLASVGAGSYNSLDGDKIEWKLESF